MDKQGIKVIRGQGKKKLPGRERFTSIIILAVLSLLFLQIGYQWVNSWLYFRRVQIVVAEPGSVDSVINVEGIIARHEEVVRSSDTGAILGKIPEGDRVPVGGEVLTIFPDYEEPDSVAEDEDISIIVYYYNVVKDWLRDIFFLDGDFDEDESGEIDVHLSAQSESISVQSPQAGIVSYEIDGLENLFLPEYPYDLLRKGREKEEPVGETPAIRRDFVSEGEPLFKIVDNWEWFFSVAVDYETGTGLRNRNSVKITFSFLPDEAINAFLVDTETDRDADLIFLTYRISRQVPGFSRYRWAEAEINYDTYEGIKVPAGAIMESEGEEGVFLNERGRVVFYPLDIIYKDDEKVIADGITPNSIIITRPDLVTEGQRLE